MTHWSGKYLGVPHRDLGRDRTGADCWGLLRLVYAAELGVELPSYAGAYHSAAEAAEIAALIDGAEDWTEWQPVTAEQPFDAALFRRGSHRSHVGIIVRPGLMLHMAETGARIEDYRLPRWSGRLTGLYRHVSQIRSPG
ncbi:C40 family peptidase [Frigidibacter sp.]|uniref:C40 family peptidase n=1 Tax=Frigidibacter sp. TaxID=2586418 RepID=UPI002733371E|nr:NlpC/P60 family protein [Frigidibacter sp.]MDP3340486.1 NlpC/P60 family protein [Frigidibacter sp.]